VRSGDPGRHGIFQNIVLSLNLCVLFFQMATKLLGQIVKLFGPNYLMKGMLGISFGLRTP
jgi:hypothetical protein